MADRKTYLEFATKLALEAAVVILDHQDATLDIETKSDNSPVTQVDKAINTLVAHSIATAFPDHGLLGEEENFGTGRERFQWLCDPLDGTKAFILGIPESTFMLALLEDGYPIISVVRDPFVQKTYSAIKGEGAQCNGKAMHVSGETLAGGLLTLDSDALDCLPMLHLMKGTFTQASATGYKCMMLAQGKVVGYINRYADHHDIGPASLIIEEAGGKVTDLNGRQLKYDNPIGTVVASNGVCHDELIALATSRDHSAS